ncbi:hypothetical protein GCM10009841_19320 [Microlunatus panaciterrae]|uniref:DUF6891 domain-containing protein n=1 Tax=Microlunatus panaciterrae TaxID=400768 RepID=A0ABS2RNC1_9ACTN|nr:hypothetical protein [Microlunatus panaciterrae]MBM7800490.1 hypothetical protein [Microlunatus panaciterrae]
MALRHDRTLQELADYARLVVRAAYLHRSRMLVEVGNFIRAEVDDPAQAERLAEQFVAEAESELNEELRHWPERTDNDALGEVLRELRHRRFLTLENCQDHFDASRALKANPEDVVGVVFFTETDVFHAITEGMLELKVWHPDTSNVVAADPELATVLELLAKHGLSAVFDEGRIEVSMTWRRHPHHQH